MLPDRSILIGQKLVENAKIQKFKCDILSNFQTMWHTIIILATLEIFIYMCASGMKKYYLGSIAAFINLEAKGEPRDCRVNMYQRDLMMTSPVLTQLLFWQASKLDNIFTRIISTNKGNIVGAHCSKSSFFVQKINFDLPEKIVNFFVVEKLVKMLWFWTF